MNMCKKIITAIALSIAIYAIMANFVNHIEGPVSFFYILIITSIFIVLIPTKLYQKFFIFYQKHTRLFLIIAIIFSLIARFAFLFLEYEPTSDPQNFQTAAISFSETGNFGTLNKYVAFYPYLAPYNVLLGISIHLFRNINFSIIILNIAFDIIATTCLYILAKKISNKITTATTAAILWLLNPINIIFTALSLPVIIVNAGIIATTLLLFMVYEAFKQPKNVKKLAILATLSGVIAGITNCFRPIMIILIIAFTITLILEIFKTKKIKLFFISMILIFIPFYVISKINLLYVAKVTNNPITTNTSSWSLYVGSNYETGGEWNPEDAEYRNKIMQDLDYDINATTELLKQKAIERISSLNPKQIIELLSNKAFILTARQRNITYNINSYPQLWKRPLIIESIQNLCGLYFLILVLFTTIFLYHLYRKAYSKVHPIIIFVTLTLVGLFFASLLVEVSVRYFAPFYPMITLFATLGISFICSKLFSQKQSRSQRILNSNRS